MKRKRFTDGQIIRILREAEREDGPVYPDNFRLERLDTSSTR
ncbi:MAG: hypothetical protein PVH68_10540 [Armatimonadota bacterium]|jgi:hypothetical protein